MHNFSRIAACFDAPTTRVLRSCLRRVLNWPHPPNWSFPDWSCEVRQLAQVAACAAVPTTPPQDSDSSQRIRRRRIMQCVLKRYRQECSYAFHSQTGALLEEAAAEIAAPTSACPTQPWLEPAFLADAANPVLEAVDSLAPAQKQMVLHLFWSEISEQELGRQLGISRHSLNKRKRKILRRLCQLLSGS